MSEKYCQNCGESSPLSAKFCHYCGEEIETVPSPQPVRQVNRVDNFVQEVRVSNVFTTTLKAYLSFIFITFCLFPALCLFMGLLGMIPLNAMLRNLLGL